MLALAFGVRGLNGSPSSQSPTSFVGLGCVGLVYVFAFAFDVSWGPTSWNVCSEIFPSEVKAPCCTITTSVQWLFQIVISAMTPTLIAKVGCVTYLVLAACGAISYVWVALGVPETRRVKLGKDMDELFTPQSEVQEGMTEVTALLG